MRNTHLAIALLAITAGAACIDRLPSQDRRILDAVPAAKLSVENLSRDYQGDAKAADKRYWGKAIEVSGVVSSRRDEAMGAALLFDDKNGTLIVEAQLLDDRAKAILASTSDSQRTTLRCYCSGSSSGHVVLKSCIAPTP
jgi:tRNA_anti-like